MLLSSTTSPARGVVSLCSCAFTMACQQITSALGSLCHHTPSSLGVFCKDIHINPLCTSSLTSGLEQRTDLCFAAGEKWTRRN